MKDKIGREKWEDTMTAAQNFANTHKKTVYVGWIDYWEGGGDTKQHFYFDLDEDLVDDSTKLEPKL